MDRAIDVMADILQDPKIDRVSKLYPAKMVLDLYATKEKLSLDERKLDLDQKKLELERAKIANGSPQFIINNGEINQNKTINEAQPESYEELQKRKHEQARLLEEASGVPQFVTEDSIKTEET